MVQKVDTKNIFEGIRGDVKLREPLNKYTTFKIGGPAQFFIRPKSIGDLKKTVCIAREQRIPIFVLGGGSNLIVSDKGVGGVVIRLDASCFKRVISEADIIEAGSGTGVSVLIRAAKARGLGGLEFLAGIPATIGGAVVMNAGAWGKNIADMVEKVRVMDYNGKIGILEKSRIRFGYRHSSLKRYLVLSVWLRFPRKKARQIEGEMSSYIACRRRTQDIRLPNAGCIFRNPPADSAGRLIEACGLKGKMIGGASVSSKHANFIVNRDHATAVDVLKLMKLIRRDVRNKFGINLRSEVKVWE